MRALCERVNAWAHTFQVKQLFAAVFVGVLVLTTSAAEANLSPGVKAELDRVTTPSGEVNRPRTTRQWEAENEELQGNPIQQLERIAEQTADAVSEMADIYPQNAKTLTPGMGNGRLPKDN